MRPIRNNINPLVLTKHRDSETQRRRHGRLRCEALRCCLGDVMDLSASGFQARRRGKPVIRQGDEGLIELTYDHLKVTLPARCVRIDQDGPRHFTYGLTFLELNDEQRQQLCELMRVSRQMLTLV